MGNRLERFPTPSISLQQQEKNNTNSLCSFIVFLCSCLEYSEDAPIEDLVQDTAMAYHRGPDKAKEWLAKLKNQDIMTIGDLKDLQDSDWAGFDLTVFASRALRNRLFGKNIKRPTSGLTRNSSGGTTDDGLS